MPRRPHRNVRDRRRARLDFLLAPDTPGPALLDVHIISCTRPDENQQQVEWSAPVNIDIADNFDVMTADTGANLCRNLVSVEQLSATTWMLIFNEPPQIGDMLIVRNIAGSIVPVAGQLRVPDVTFIEGVL